MVLRREIRPSEEICYFKEFLSFNCLAALLNDEDKGTSICAYNAEVKRTAGEGGNMTSTRILNKMSPGP
jgi:hypothetical protein